jgi:hypothetical protein
LLSSGLISLYSALNYDWLHSGLVYDWLLIYDWLHYESVTLRLAVNGKFILVTSLLRLKTRNCIFQLNSCEHTPYVTFSLTTGRVCRLQLLLALASAVIRSESRRTHDHILLFQIRDSPNLEGQFPVFIPLGTGWPSYTPKHWVPFRCLLRLAGLRWKYSTPPRHAMALFWSQRPIIWRIGTQGNACWTPVCTET